MKYVLLVGRFNFFPFVIQLKLNGCILDFLSKFCKNPLIKVALLISYIRSYVYFIVVLTFVDDINLNFSYFLYYLLRILAGEYVGLTGARLDGAEMHACGLATHFVPSSVSMTLIIGLYIL